MSESNEIEYIEPTQEHVGQMVEVYDGTSWPRRRLLAVLGDQQECRFICENVNDSTQFAKWCSARISRPMPQPNKEPSTRAGAVYGWAARADYPVIWIIDGAVETLSWAITGLQFIGQPSGYDLENAPQRIQKTWWMNVFDDGSFDRYETKELADADRGRGIFACVPFVIDCEDGEGL